MSSLKVVQGLGKSKTAEELQVSFQRIILAPIEIDSQYEFRMVNMDGNELVVDHVVRRNDL